MERNHGIPGTYEKNPQGFKAFMGYLLGRIAILGRFENPFPTLLAQPPSIPHRAKPAPLARKAKMTQVRQLAFWKLLLELLKIRCNAGATQQLSQKCHVGLRRDLFSHRVRHYREAFLQDF